MARRSFPITLGLLLTPTIILLVLRMSLPVIDSILVSDRNMLIGIHVFAVLIGLILIGRGNKNKDHEFLRSGAIDRLSRTYGLEDGGLWSRADEALARLERRNSKKKPVQMSEGVASINAESRELDLGDQEPGDIRVSGVEVSTDTGDEQNPPGPENTLTIKRKSRGFSAWLDRRAEKVARKRLDKMRLKHQENK